LKGRREGSTDEAEDGWVSKGEDEGVIWRGTWTKWREELWWEVAEGEPLEGWIDERENG
jgi:hypothetical protein